MPDLMDSFALMADHPFSELGWTDMDSLFMAAVCYNRFGSLAAGPVGMALSLVDERLDQSAWADLPHSAERARLLHLMAQSRRYGLAIISHYVDIIDNSRPIQFSACVIRAPGAPAAICYRGTDNTITGWREDMYMSFESPVPGQTAAQAYLKLIAEDVQGPIVLSGHSKGGNLAHWAAVTASPELQQRIVGAWSFDGPGLDDAMVSTRSYERMEPRLHSFVPQGSIIGLMKTYQSDLHVVNAKSSGIQQHDVFTWETNGIDFVPAEHMTLSSRVMDKTLHSFLKSCTPNQRHTVVDALFDLLDATECGTVHALGADKGAVLSKIAAGVAKMDPDTRSVFLHVASTLLQSGAGSVVDVAQDSKAAESLRAFLESAQNSKAAESIRNMIEVAQPKAADTVRGLIDAAQSSKAADTVRSVWENNRATAENLLNRLKHNTDGLVDGLMQTLHSVDPRTKQPPKLPDEGENDHGNNSNAE